MNILNGDEINRRLVVILAIIMVALTALGIWLTFSVLLPTPPHSVAMAIDPQGSFDGEVGKRYRELLARDGIDLRLVPTAGAVESIARLRDASRVSASPLFPGVSPTGRSPHGWSPSEHCFTNRSGCFPTTNISKRTSNSATSAFPLAPRAAPAISWRSSS